MDFSLSNNKFCMVEVWKNIDLYDGYQVSNFGRVKSVHRTIFRNDGRTAIMSEKVLKDRYNPRGYSYICINRKNYAVHRLVATAFLYKNENQTDVNHKNCIKSDNAATNLEWCTKKENTKHAIDNDRFVRKYGKDNPLSIKINQLCKENGILIKVWDSFSDIKREMGLDIKSLVYCCQGKMYKSVGGFKWQYQN